MRNLNRATGVLMALVVCAAASWAMAGEIGYPEDFALAKDRQAALKQLIPGTVEFYYYNALNYQNLAQLDKAKAGEYLGKVDELLKPWIERYGRNGQVMQIENRQALLRYGSDPRKSLDFLVWRLGLTFSHQRETSAPPVQLPTALDNKVISEQVLANRAISNYPGSMGGFEELGLDLLASANVLDHINNVDHEGLLRRDLLGRLKRPDYPGLVKLVNADLDYRNSGGFGSMPIHSQMLLSQLDELLKMRPKLLNETNFVCAYLTKLRPTADADWRHDRAVQKAFLDRAWEFVSKLAPAHNSLKAHVLYYRLWLARSAGEWDKEMFLEYLKLPRPCGYMRPEYLQSDVNRLHMANLGDDYSTYTQMPAIGVDEGLVQSYLMHFLTGAENMEPYVLYVDSNYLKRLYAQANLLAGKGDAEKWFSLLNASEVAALKERVDIDFGYVNHTVNLGGTPTAIFGSDEPVSLEMELKNVPKLLVKVFEINAMNYYRTNLQPIGTDIELDGLVANEEKGYTYDAAPVRRHGEKFDFPSLKKPGVYVVEFIGNGKSSRALVQKGSLRHLVRNSVAGQVFTILDDGNKLVKDATIWVAGHEYRADEQGRITVPFSNQPNASQPFIISRGTLATLAYYQQQGEAYGLNAGFYVDRENLLKRRLAKLIVRPTLLLNGEQVTNKVLEEVTLGITSVDREGISTTKEIKDFKIFDDKESTYDFTVPDNVLTIAFTLRAKVQSLTQNKKIDLAHSQPFGLNGIDQTNRVEDLHLGVSEGRYTLDLLGKTGEIKPLRAVNVALKHRAFKEIVNASLRTDDAGRVMLGELKDIDYITATGPEGGQHTWMLPRDLHNYSPSINAKAGQIILVPYMGRASEVSAAEFSLLEKRGVTFVADRINAIKLEDGLLMIEGLGGGEYSLLIKSSQTMISLNVADGQAAEGYVLTANRQVQMRNVLPLQIAAMEADKDTVRVRVANAGPYTRVHLLASRYVPAYSVFEHLDTTPDNAPIIQWANPMESFYIAGRNIGDEYRYILERRYAKKYPGNMLTRAGLLLNPWAIDKTVTAPVAVTAGESIDRLSAPMAAFSRELNQKNAMLFETKPQDTPDLDFLSQTSVVLADLVPDKDGMVTVKRADLGAHQQIGVLAVDDLNTVYRTISLEMPKMPFMDLRLGKDALDGSLHFTEQKQATAMEKDGKLVIADIGSGRYEVYDSLAKVYGLYVTLSNDPTLVEFSFIANWPKLTPEQQREKYAQYACHELNFFLYHKDKAFFEKVIAPYLKNKKAKTFMDEWLLGGDLSGYTQPWAFGQLNAAERILLGQRLAEQGPSVTRHINDLYDLVPPDLERLDYLFKTALRGSGLDAGKALVVSGVVSGSGMLTLDGSAVKGYVSNGTHEVEVPILQAGRALAPSAPAAAMPAPTVSFGAGATRGVAAGGGGLLRDAKDAEVRTQDEARDMPATVQHMEKAVAAKEQMKKVSKELGAIEDRSGSLAVEGKDLARRRDVRQMYQAMDKTQEWAENNYYHLPLAQSNGQRVAVNAFWLDLAKHDGKGLFLSPNIAQASHNFTEMMLAMAVLDLPFEAAKNVEQIKDNGLTLTAGGPAIVFHKEIKPATEALPMKGSSQAAQKTPILVSQNYFRASDRYRYEGNERVDKYVSDEFLISVVYGCQVVVTNPTSSPQKLTVLVQVPKGAMPVANSLYTRSLLINLPPYGTQTVEYYFYFPMAGEFGAYPVQVAKNEQLIAYAPPLTLKAVAQLTNVDQTSWDWISQNGDEKQVVTFLKDNNIDRLNLEKIAWRMGDKGFFEQVIGLLGGRHVYNATLWSYGLKHDVPAAARQYLSNNEGFLLQCGLGLESELVTIDPVVRKWYEHLEYAPLVNARAHRLGKERKIPNDKFYAHYMQLMNVLSYRPALDSDDRLAVTYYLLLQDRIEEGLEFLAQVKGDDVATKVQYDYLRAYADFYTDDVKSARAIAQKYEKYPEDRWRKLFVNVLGQLDELEGKGANVVDEKDREQAQSALAASEPGMEVSIEGVKVTVNFQNLTEVRVNYYPMDLELLFSKSPFVQQLSGQFAYIKPTQTATVKLPKVEEGKGKARVGSTQFELPKDLQGTNVMVEVVAGGVRKSQPYYANRMVVQMLENYGQVKVTNAAGAPLPKVYVKAYARDRGGEVKFYKDGYTDLRGRFDYVSLNTNELDNVERFSLLIMSETDGAVVREAAPPKQ